ncbi:MAG TPA: ATP-dependent DNA helicase, partial [Thermoplasmata archaeon]|nr:ATP-dependent DNA helicase [Thermoplasmata archaeon]
EDIAWNNLTFGRDGLESAWETLPTAEEFTGECASRGICAYEAAKRLIPGADVVVVPYNFAFHPFMRRRMEMLMGTLDSIVLVVDEAHNLPDFARDLASTTLTMASLDRCEGESRDWKDPLLAGRITASRFVAVLQEILADLVDEYVYEDDGALPPYEVSTELMSRLGVTSHVVGEIVTDLHRHGTAIRDAKRASGRLPRSYLLNLANFLIFWNEMMEEDYVQLVIGGPNPAIEAFCMNPARIAGVANAFHSSVHMSGTLRPLDEYRDSVGLPPDTTLLTVPSPFPPGNLQVAYVNDVTTRYEDIRFDGDNRARIMRHLLACLGAADRSAAVFFPSYRLMNEFLDAGLASRLGRPVFVERRGMTQAEFAALIGRFRRASSSHARGGVGVSPTTEGGGAPVETCGDAGADGEADGGPSPEVGIGGPPAPTGRSGAPGRRTGGPTQDMGRRPVLFGVMGGRAGEGMDFPGEQLEMVIIVGLPYPKPTARQRALQHYYDLRFGRGWEYTVHAPAARRVRQAIGRIVRSETDRGMALILDRRAQHFGGDIPGLRMTADPLAEIHGFWRDVGRA